MSDEQGKGTGSSIIRYIYIYYIYMLNGTHTFNLDQVQDLNFLNDKKPLSLTWKSHPFGEDEPNLIPSAPIS